MKAISVAKSKIKTPVKKPALKKLPEKIFKPKNALKKDKAQIDKLNDELKKIVEDKPFKEKVTAKEAEYDVLGGLAQLEDESDKMKEQDKAKVTESSVENSVRKKSVDETPKNKEEKTIRKKSSDETLKEEEKTISKKSTDETFGSEEEKTIRKKSTDERFGSEEEKTICKKSTDEALKSKEKKVDEKKDLKKAEVEKSNKEEKATFKNCNIIDHIEISESSSEDESINDAKNTESCLIEKAQEEISIIEVKGK